jgi:uncharacterized protein DUF5677
MKPDDAVAEFARYHALNTRDLLLEERAGIACVADCHNAINEGYVNLPSDVLDRDICVGLLWQLYERCTEQIQGALVAMVTACPASSEVLARASLEATVAVRYILGDRNTRMASFLKDHIDRAERQEKYWRKDVEQLAKGQERSIHLAACDYRRQGISAMKSIVEPLIAQLVPSGRVRPWGTIESRFQKIGKNLSYRTIYARVCAEPHFDAEATLRYFIGTITSPEILNKLAVETVMFSRFMLAEAVRAYAETGKEYAQAYGMEAVIRTCEAAENLMLHHSLNLSRHTGAEPLAPDHHQKALIW